MLHTTCFSRPASEVYSAGTAAMPPHAFLARKESPLDFVKNADGAPTAALPDVTASSDAWSIKAGAVAAVQRRATVCTDAAHAPQCMDIQVYPPTATFRLPSADIDTAAAFADCVATAASGVSLSLDLELTAAEAMWLVQAPALPVVPAAAKQPAATTARKQRPARPALMLRALRCCGGALARGCAAVRGKLAGAAACFSAPRTAEPACTGCPGRRIINAAAVDGAEWNVTHVNWS